MKKLDEVDSLEIEKLLKYIPIIKDPSFKPLNEEEPGAGIEMNYSQKADEFIKAVSTSYWIKMNYDEVNAKRLIDDITYIESTSVEDIKDLFSFLHREEKFNAGLFNFAFREGLILSCLDRLKFIYQDD